jgi:hypothetical protein
MMNFFYSLVLKLYFLKSFLKTKKDANYILTIQDKLNQFYKYNMRGRFLRPGNQSIIGIKWVFKNKIDEHRTMVRNKVALVAKNYNQEEGIDYEKTMTNLS